MLEYNTERNKLIIKEYGRNIQKMVEYALAIEDDQERTETAKAIVKVMSQINPEVKDVKREGDSVDYWGKLWDHLIIISDYKLDVDSPFPKPKPEIRKPVMHHSDYRKSKIMYRTYGRNMENIVKKVSEYPDPIRTEMSKILANHLKKLYLIYNRDSVDDTLIVKQLLDMSGGKLQLPKDFTLETTRDILKQNQTRTYSKPMNNGAKKMKKKRKKIN